jgi:hypothetical protein
MQTLKFNTTTKTVILLDGPVGSSKILQTFENVPTVKCSELGFYEVMQKETEFATTVIPVMRLPISNTNMIISK